MATPDALGSVLVLGGCGFLGHHIVKALLSAPDVTRVTVFDLYTDANRQPNVHYVSGSITSRADIMSVLESAKPSVIFHTISPPPLGPESSFTAVNIDGTRLLLECAQACSEFVKALVYTSSSSVIHDNHSDLAGVTEDLPLLFAPQQTMFYSHTKAVAEDLCLKANGINGVLTCAIRPAGLFGEGDRTISHGACQRAKEGKARMQIGRNEKLFDWTYAPNNADAQVLAARALLRAHPSNSRTPMPKEMRVDGEAFVITNDDPWPFWDFMRALGGAAGYPTKPSDVRVIPAWFMWGVAIILESLYWVFTLGRKQPQIRRQALQFTTIHRYYDISKAKKRLGYKPRVGMEEGIARTGVWWVKMNDEERRKTEAHYNKM
jgi:sterol-4alpha-carboxylate 3-dehydrogenase (decarboxylating)